MQSKLESTFIASIPSVDQKALKLYEENPLNAVSYLTEVSNKAGSETFNTWKSLYSYLFMKYMDGNIKTARELPEGYKYITPDLSQPGYSPEKYKLIIEQTGDRFKVKGEAH
jgi:hypothetical protein